MSDSICPICGSIDLVEFNGRLNAQCVNCGALERHRYMYMLMDRMGILKPNMSILHIAPEFGLFKNLSELTQHYNAVSFELAQYEHWTPTVKFIDLCNLDEVFDGTFDLIIHNHVLEHVPCSVSKTISDLQNLLNQDGVMIFSIPIWKNSDTIEDLNPNLTEVERIQMFGQRDHVRIFGDQNVLEVLQGQENNPVSIVDPYDYLTDSDLQTACIPLSTEVNGQTMFRVNYG